MGRYWARNAEASQTRPPSAVGSGAKPGERGCFWTTLILANHARLVIPQKTRNRHSEAVGYRTIHVLTLFTAIKSANSFERQSTPATIDGHLNTCPFRRAVDPGFAITDHARGRDWDHPNHHHAADLSGQAALPAGKREDLMILVKSRDYRN
jgi:hypothetical protein